MDRTKFVWDVTLTDEGGTKITNTEFASFWSPDKIESISVATAAAATASYIGKRKFVPVSAALR